MNSESDFSHCSRDQLEHALEITLSNLEMAQNYASADNDRRNAASGLHAALRALGYVVKDVH